MSGNLGPERSAIEVLTGGTGLPDKGAAFFALNPLYELAGGPIARTLFKSLANTKYGVIKLDGVADDTAVANAAAADANTDGGGVVWGPKGTLATVAGLTWFSNVNIDGVGKSNFVIKAGSGASGAAILAGAFTNIEIEHTGFDGSANATMVRAISITGNGNKKFIRLRDCAFSNFSPVGGQAVYVWTAECVWVEDCEFLTNRTAIFMDQPQGEVFVRGNRVFNSTAATMAYGIQIQSAGQIDGSVEVSGNTVDGANLDPSGNGSGAWGIYVTKVTGVKVFGNTCLNCGAATGGGGILLGLGAYNCTASLNTCRNNPLGTGIFLEHDGALTTVGTAGVNRGQQAIGNTCYGNLNGIVVSFAAASSVVGNICHDNNADGIICDSDRCTIEANICFNNYKTAGAPAQLQKAGIRVYGNNCSIKANQCFDNQSVQTQAYGIAASDGTHTIEGNQVSGNLTGGIFEAASGASNVVRGNPGYISEQTGSGTLAAAATTAVGFGTALAIAPPASLIDVKFTGDHGQPRFWLTAISTTGFTINFPAAALAVGYAYSARRTA